MLGDKKVIVTFPSSDMGRTIEFYEKLGLKAYGKPDDDGVYFEAGEGTGIFVYQKGKSKADHTQASFGVDDLEKEVKELKEKGIEFEDYNLPEFGIETKDGIATLTDEDTPGMPSKAAWIKDPDDNIIVINQMPQV